MPVYEYFCQECEKKFDVKASIAEKEKGLKISCPNCASAKTIQVLSNFFTLSKGGSSKFGGGCGLNPTPGCCG